MWRSLRRHGKEGHESVGYYIPHAWTPQQVVRFGKDGPSFDKSEYFEGTASRRDSRGLITMRC